MENEVPVLECVYRTELGDFKLFIRSFTRKQFETLARKHRRPFTDKKTRKTEMEIDNETYYPALCRSVVEKFEDLTEEVKALVMREPVPSNGTDPKAIVPFTWDVMIGMYRTSTKLAEYVEAIAMNFEDVLGEQRLAEREARNNAKVLKQEVPN